MKTVTLESFVTRYQPLITVDIDWPKLLASDIRVLSHRWRLPHFQSLNMPWYSHDGQLSMDFYATKNDPKYRPVKLRDALSYEPLSHRANRRVGHLPHRLHPIPIATDTRTGQSLILDSNTTLTALLATSVPASRRFSAIELAGEDCHTWLPDFHVLNRPR